MGMKELFDRLFLRQNKSEPRERPRPMMPEEVELNSYLEEDRRDKIRAMVLKKRAERLKKLFGNSNYDLNIKKKQIRLRLPKAKPTKIGFLSPARL